MSANSELWEHVETNLIKYRPNGMYYVKAKIHGKKVMVHEMTMDDGTVVYGLSKADFLRMDARRMLEQGHS